MSFFKRKPKEQPAPAASPLTPQTAPPAAKPTLAAVPNFAPAPVAKTAAVLPETNDLPFEAPEVKLEETGTGIEYPKPESTGLSLLAPEQELATAAPISLALAAPIPVDPRSNSESPKPAAPAFKPPKITLDVPSAPESKPPAFLAPAAPAAAPAAPMPDGLKSQILPARAFRVSISPLHRLSFLPAQPILKGREEARLCNISTSGVGLVATDFIRPPQLNDLIDGSLVFESGSFPVQLKIMHITSGVIGSKFEGEPRGVREAIKTYFELELLALGMLKVNPAHHKAESDGNAHWIHGDQCELFYVTDGAGKLIRFRLTFLGNRFVWSKTGGLNVGQVVDDRVGMMRTDRIAVMEATPEITDLALRFLHNIPQVPQEHRQQIGNSISPGYELKPKT